MTKNSYYRYSGKRRYQKKKKEKQETNFISKTVETSKGTVDGNAN